MGSMSIWHWLVVALVVLLLFGRNKISDLMGDLAKGIKSFKKGMAEDDADKPATATAEPPKSIAAEPAQSTVSAQAAPPPAQPAPAAQPQSGMAPKAG